MNRETINKAISAWKGECEWFESIGSRNYCDKMQVANPACHNCDYNINTDYTTDYSAWDEDMFKLIEERGMAIRYAVELEHILSPDADLTEYDSYDAIMLISKSTPAQKAEALYRAIEESK